tara:strand:- start:13536 stop:13802 length:267 start_codon:yes stop_codon:yes gene_type:complete
MALTPKERKQIAYGTKKAIAEEISLSDSTTYDLAFNIYVGSGGNLKVDTTAGNTITLTGIQSGTYIDWIEVTKLYKTGSTAKGIVAIY